MDKSKILIVEDSKVAAAHIQKFLESKDYYVQGIATTGDEAIEAVKRNQPDLIIMDIVLKGEIDGIESALVIKKNFDIPFIFLTGSTDDLNNKRIRKTGYYSYLTKPFKEKDLFYSIDSSLHKHRAKKLMKESENRLNSAYNEIDAILASLSTFLIGVSSKDRITHWNSIAEKTFNIKAEECIGKPFLTIPIKLDWSKIYMGIADSISNDTTVKLKNINYINKKGAKAFLEITINRIRDKDNFFKGFLLSGEDITKKKHLEMQLAQAQKLESIGLLASGIAHEINTPLQYITDNLYYFKESFSPILQLITKIVKLVDINKIGNPIQSVTEDIHGFININDISYLVEEIPKAIDQSIEGLSHVAKIVQSMKRFAHPGGNNKVSADINRLIRDTVTISRNEWKYATDVKTEFDDTLPSINCFPGEINQVILNLIVNAAHAIDDKAIKGTREKGIIKIITEKKGKYIIIKIKDNGKGIPNNIQKKIFDPFFTTKTVNKGTGQGLPIVYNIITKNHNGKISFRSKEGMGTIFVIKLPVNEYKNNGETP